MNNKFQNSEEAADMELINLFSDAWLGIDAYDKDELAKTGATKKSVQIGADELARALKIFNEELLKRGQASDLSGIEKDKGGLAGIFGNVMQSFDGRPIYSTVEEKAAHLLYFMIKDHPFVDGNKRNGAYAFIWFLKKTGILDAAKINSQALTVLTLFVAESDAENKDRIIRLILQILKK